MEFIQNLSTPSPAYKGEIYMKDNKNNSENPKITLTNINKDVSLMPHIEIKLKDGSELNDAMSLIHDDVDELKDNVDTLTGQEYLLTNRVEDLLYHYKKQELWIEYLSFKNASIMAILEYIQVFISYTPWYKWLFKKTREDFRKGLNECKDSWTKDLKNAYDRYTQYTKEVFEEELEEGTYGI